MKQILCKECLFWQPWKLPQGKTLSGHFKTARKGDCFNQKSDQTTTYSSDICDYAELKESGYEVSTDDSI